MSEARRDAGAVMALLDRAMADAARGRAGEGRDVAAIEIHVAFLKQGSGPLSATSRVCGGGKSVCFCEAEAADAQGHLVARGMGTFRALRPSSVEMSDGDDVRLGPSVA
jgi:fatty-acyl-CoA synthase